MREELLADSETSAEHASWAWWPLVGAVGLMAGALLPWVRVVERTFVVSSATTTLGVNVNPPWTWLLVPMAVCVGWAGWQSLLSRRGARSTRSLAFAELALGVGAVAVVASSWAIVRSGIESNLSNGSTTTVTLFPFWLSVASAVLILVSALAALLRPSQVGIPLEGRVSREG